MIIIFLKAISLDIEVIPLNINQMPTADTCPVVLISNYFNHDVYIKGTKTRNIVLILTKEYQGLEVHNDYVVYFFIDESKLIEAEFILIRENDIITSFNGNGFDIPYLIDRSRNLGIRKINIGNSNNSLYYRVTESKGFKVTKILNVTGKIVFDILAVLKREDATNKFLKKYNLKILKLEHVAKEILGIEKLEFSIEEMVKYWNNTNDIELRNRFILYCRRDSELALLFLTKFRLLDKFIGLSKASGKILQEVIDSQGSGAMVENLLLKEFGKHDRVLPIRMKRSTRELSGAEVARPILGMSEDVCSVDYKSLYPSLIVRHNICFTTIILENPKELNLVKDDISTQTTEEGVPYARFVKREKYVGIIPKILTGLLEKRASIKKEMKKYEKDSINYLMYDSLQDGVKILLNSFYGYSGDQEAKLYFWEIATAVTTSGRKQIKTTWNMILNDIAKVKVGEREFGFMIIQGDTDSSYIRVLAQDNLPISRTEAISAVTNVLNKVNSTLQKPMSLDFENYIKRIIIVAKKRYAMLVEDDKGKENIVSKGIETIRRDWSNFSTDNMAKVIDILLKEKDIQVGVNKSVELVKEQIELLNNEKVDLKNLVLSNKLTKALTSYDNEEAHVKVAIKMAERGKKSEMGDRIQFIVLDNGMELIADKAEEAEYVIKNPDKCKIDKHYYKTKQLIPPVLRIFELLGLSKDVLLIKLDGKQRDLMSSFTNFGSDEKINSSMMVEDLNIKINKQVEYKKQKSLMEF